MSEIIPVLVPMPAHGVLRSALSYRSELPLAPGTLVRVPLGGRETLGVVWDAPPAGDSPVSETSSSTPAQAPTQAAGVGSAGVLRDILGPIEGLPPVSAPWRALVNFAARYYQRTPGEVALAALPPQLRSLDLVQVARRLKRRASQIGAEASAGPPAIAMPVLNAMQAEALARIEAEPGPFLLFGHTGSGKTEVYLRAVLAMLAREPMAQALVMVPEINLTPQLLQRLRERLVPLLGEQAVVAMHSGMTPPQRLQSWLAAHLGQARVVLGTRMAVFASMPELRLIVVDEEHDPSYKQQEGARYSARDLAVLRASLPGTMNADGSPAPACRVVLGSATPSLESWHQSRPAAEGGRYLRLTMGERIGVEHNTDASRGLPPVHLQDMSRLPAGTVLAPALLDALRACIGRGEQALMFLNRRGYAPVLACLDCGWKSECPHCSAFRVFHKIDRTLRCHHCAFTERVPRGCPSCGNVDTRPVGRGTEQLQEQLEALLASVTRPDGQALRLLRIDADTTRAKGALEQQLALVHAGEVDVLVGTQMIAKGHDFRRVGLVAALNPDGGLFSSDFRAPERLFSLLLQAAGRAGRDVAQGQAASVWIQTCFVQHPLFAALRRHDYPGFAEQQLLERAQAGLPPFSSQALLRAEARDQAVAQRFLNLASEAAQHLPEAERITCYPAVPMSLQRVANVERAQLLVESSSRAALQRFLAAWQPVLHASRADPACKGLIRWAIDVDPLAI